MKVIPVTYLMKVIPVTYLMKVIPVTYLMKLFQKRIVRTKLDIYVFIKDVRIYNIEHELFREVE